MQITITRISDTISPDLQARLALAGNKASIHQDIGMELVNITRRAFTHANLRAAPWPAKVNGQPATLKSSGGGGGTLAKSPRVVSANGQSVTIGSDRHYAAIHQLGGKTAAHVIRPKAGKKALNIPGIGFRKKVNHPGSKIPARPYFPFYQDGRPTPAAHTAILQVLEKRLRP